MEFFAGIWDYIVPFILVLTVLVYVHEMGHYLVARWNGVRVETFSIGFGPELFGRTDRAGTRWKFSAIPLGGYVKMFGDANAASAGGATEGMTAEETRVSFIGKKLWQRAAIVFAGPFANFLFAILALAVLLVLVGQPFTPVTVGSVEEGGPAAQAGLKPGDKILRIDGSVVKRLEELQFEAAIEPDDPIELTVERAGETMTLTVVPERVEIEDTFGRPQVIGNLGLRPIVPAVVGGVIEGGAAERAGFRAGDRIVAIGDRQVQSFAEIRDIVLVNPGELLPFTVERDGRMVVLEATPEPFERTAESGSIETVGRLGIRSGGAQMVRYGPVEAVGEAVSETAAITVATLKAIGQMIAGSRGTESLAGPVGIAQMIGDVAQVGLYSTIRLMAILSLSLGLINLLPVPLLDGGHLLFYAVEAVRGKPLSERAQEYGFRVGLALVLTLMLFVTWNDLVHLDVVDFIRNIVS